MKSRRVLCALILLVLCFARSIPAYAAAEIPDFSSMTTEEIMSFIDAAQDELLSRKAEEDGGSIILVDQDGVKVYMTGNHSVAEYGNGTIDLNFDVVVINNSDRPITVGYKQASVNGWNVGFLTNIGQVPAATKTKGTIGYRLSDADISSFAEVEEIATSFYISDAEAWREIFTTDIVRLTF